MTMPKLTEERITRQFTETMLPDPLSIDPAQRAIYDKIIGAASEQHALALSYGNSDADAMRHTIYAIAPMLAAVALTRIAHLDGGLGTVLDLNRLQRDLIDSIGHGLAPDLLPRVEPGPDPAPVTVPTAEVSEDTAAG